MKRGDIRTHSTLGTPSWGRARLTTLLDFNQMAALKRVADATQIPMSRLVAQALDDFFQKVGVLNEPESPPIDPQFILRKVAAYGRQAGASDVPTEPKALGQA